MHSNSIASRGCNQCSTLMSPTHTKLRYKYQRINHFINAVSKDTTSTNPSSSTDTITITKQYLSWANDAKIAFPKVTQAVFEGNLRGMKALDTISPDETFITVPRNAALVIEPKGRCPCPEFTSPEYWKQAPWYVQMTLLLLREKKRGKESPVWGYILQLPATIDSPIRWTDQEIKEFQYMPLQLDIQKQKSLWKQQYDQFIQGSEGLPGSNVSWEEYIWAAECVRSRAFSGPFIGASFQERLRVAGAVSLAGIAYITWAHIPLEQALNGAIAAAVFNLLYDVILSNRLKWYAMCPIIDSLNHISKVDSTINYEFFSDSFSAASAAAYQPGQQVYISYGNQSNDSLCQYYGFIEKNNPFDVVSIDIQSAQYNNDTTTSTNDTANDTTGVDMSIKATLKGITSDSMKTLKSLYADEDVQQRIISLFENELSLKETTLAADESLLSTAHLLSDRKRAAIEFRIEKKKLMLAVIEKAKKKQKKN